MGVWLILTPHQISLPLHLCRQARLGPIQVSSQVHSSIPIETTLHLASELPGGLFQEPWSVLATESTTTPQRMAPSLSSLRINRPLPIPKQTSGVFPHRCSCKTPSPRT